MTKDTSTLVTGARAKEIRTTAGMTQKTFWKSLGCSQSAGCAYEDGKREIPRSAQLLLLATYTEKSGDAAKVTRAAEKARKILGEALS